MPSWDDEQQPASHFLFERRPIIDDCVDRRPGHHWRSVFAGRSVLIDGNRPPYCLTRREECVLPGMEAPTLTVTSDPYNSIALLGNGGPNWSITFCARGEGATEEEAQKRLRQVGLRVSTSTVAVIGPDLYDGYHNRGNLIVKGPKQGGVVIHAAFSAVTVRDITGPVNVAASHARASILGATGQVDAIAYVIDYAGGSGRVTLSAGADINLKITAHRFEGTLLAWAQHSVRVLVPPGFATPIEAIVADRGKFVCRSDFSSAVKRKSQGELSVFTYDVDEGKTGQPGLHLRSEESTVVIDTVQEPV